MSTGLATCPCLSGSTTLPNGGTVLLAGKTYDYPASYGLGTCEKHDETLAPYCSVGTGRSPPEWCADTWCYVDPANCADLVTTNSVFFPGLKYSYSTCGDANTFDSWFRGNDDSHTLADLTNLVSGYLESMVEALEENMGELAGVSSCDIETSCSCDGCKPLSDLAATPDWCESPEDCRARDPTATCADDKCDDDEFQILSLIHI